MVQQYVLNDRGEPVPEPNIFAFAKWYDKFDSRVALDDIGEVRVSTVFLGIDHQHGNGPPILWETKPRSASGKS